ncbi:hypothetical protein BKA70DRAFT_70388 [Coprinopsis sp. MPI-PUGE-AT-0042]|nr:hypothetical protein BKA70DRAFT_70388 [Coprinopsis sp. MPI-PUGE-AT-0042]
MKQISMLSCLPSSLILCLTDMPQIPISELSIFELRGYREFFFAHCVANSSHNPYFSLSNARAWIQTDALKMYSEQDGSITDQSKPKTQDLLGTVSVTKLDAYRAFIIPEALKSAPFFSLDEVENWFFDEPFSQWSEWSKENGQDFSDPEQHRGRSRSLSSASMASIPRSSSEGTTSSRFGTPQSETIEISDSEDLIPAKGIDSESDDEIIFMGRKRAVKDTKLVKSRYNGKKNKKRTSLLGKPPKSEPASPLPGLLFNTNSSPAASVKRHQEQGESSPPKRRKGSTAMVLEGRQVSRHDPVLIQDGTPQKITSKLVVDEVEVVTTLPETWTVPRTKRAYLVNLDDLEMPKARKGEPEGMTMARYIRSQDQDSWDGSSGSPRGDANVWGLTDSDSPVLCRRAGPLKCNGLEVCAHFDKALLDNCERYEPERGESQVLWEQQLSAHEVESSSSVAILGR